MGMVARLLIMAAWLWGFGARRFAHWNLSHRFAHWNLSYRLSHWNLSHRLSHWNLPHYCLTGICLTDCLIGIFLAVSFAMQGPSADVEVIVFVARWC